MADTVITSVNLVDAVLEDVIERLVEENGMEIAVLDWQILENIRDACQNSGEDSPE